MLGPWCNRARPREMLAAFRLRLTSCPSHAHLYYLPCYGCWTAIPPKFIFLTGSLEHSKFIAHRLMSIVAGRQPQHTYILLWIVGWGCPPTIKQNVICCLIGLHVYPGSICLQFLHDICGGHLGVTRPIWVHHAGGGGGAPDLPGVSPGPPGPSGLPQNGSPGPPDLSQGPIRGHQAHLTGHQAHLGVTNEIRLIWTGMKYITNWLCSNDCVWVNPVYVYPEFDASDRPIWGITAEGSIIHRPCIYTGNWGS